MKRKIRLKIRRHRPGSETPPRFEIFSLTIDAESSVLDALEMIQGGQDPSLMFRRSCHHSSCGTCGMLINGDERLACVTRISQFKGGTVTLEPLPGFPLLGDLAVDMTPFYRDIDEGWDYLRGAENLGGTKLPDGVERFERFENCIECGCCVSACPVAGEEKPFMGPAALAALNRELQKTEEPATLPLLEQAGSERGERLCNRTLACSRVCPTAVYPARHILDLRTRLRGGRREP
ncbi:MAG: succinate dehydrogenase/fumarate reductase iron-sulfur subunit [Spirochaetes bacterium]|nr:succinate dehydrogenase/fumarate reductase iron-sulfur subunit [Spirochaetota bacterium]